MRAREFLLTGGKILRRRQIEENVDVKLADTIEDVEIHDAIRYDEFSGQEKTRSVQRKLKN